MSMSLDGYIAGLNDEPGTPGGDGFERLREWFGFGPDGSPARRSGPVS
ncbi:MAG TPA: riboflavin biosynthesis protein RibD, partial [Actinomycetota bacterium]